MEDILIYWYVLSPYLGSYWLYISRRSENMEKLLFISDVSRILLSLNSAFFLYPYMYWNLWICIPIMPVIFLDIFIVFDKNKIKDNTQGLNKHFFDTRIHISKLNKKLFMYFALL